MSIFSDKLFLVCRICLGQTFSNMPLQFLLNLLRTRECFIDPFIPHIGKWFRDLFDGFLCFLMNFHNVVKLIFLQVILNYWEIINNNINCIFNFQGFSEILILSFLLFDHHIDFLQIVQNFFFVVIDRFCPSDVLFELITKKINCKLIYCLFYS